MRKHTVIIEDFEDASCELNHEPVEWIDMLKAKVGDKIVIAYCVQDSDYRDVGDLMGDCMGQLLSFHRHNSKEEHQTGLEALGNDREGEKNLDKVWDKHWREATNRLVSVVFQKYELDDIVEMYDGTQYELIDGCLDAQLVEGVLRQDCESYGWANIMYYDDMLTVLSEMWEEPAYFPGDRDAQLLACYDHGGQSWSLSGSGMQCRWDTSNSAGVWVPDEYLRKQLDADEAKGEDRDGNARKYCEQFLSTYNDIIDGNVYGCVVEWFDEDGKTLGDEACWGFIGDHAEEALKDEFFDPVCARLQDEYDREVHTQGGRQTEIAA